MEKTRWFLSIVLVSLSFSFIHAVHTSSVNLTCEYEAMTEFLHEVAENYKEIAQLVSIGTTDEGREIWTMIVSDSPYNRPLLRPQVKLVGNVNGMSGSACYVLLRLIKHLVEEYKSEASMERKLLESVEIHIIPNLNPDGYAKAVPGSCFGKDGRLNANNVNLNTNFPDLFKSDDDIEEVALQKETEAMIRWMMKNKFTISLSLISGVKVVVYPFDTLFLDDQDGFPEFGEQHLTPDDDIYKHLAWTYARKTETPEIGWYCPGINRQFPLGIVNGAEWQPQSGTMMDFNYIHGTFEVMAGVACCRNEANTTILDQIWWDSREGLLHVIHEVDSGIRGQVLDAETYDAIPEANLSKKEYDFIEGEPSIYSMPFFSTKQGEFWRPWRPGVYKLRVEAVGYKTKLVDVQVHRHQPTFIRVELEKVDNATIHHERFTSTTTTPSSYSVDGEREWGNESIKKMTTSHQPDDDFFSDKRDMVRINDYDFAATTSTTSKNKPTTTMEIMETTSNESAVQETPVVRESTSTKQFSSLRQIDHSFISLIRGIDGLRNNGSFSIKSYPIYNIITMCLLVHFLLRRYQLAGKEIV